MHFEVNEKAEDDLHNALEDRFGIADEIADKEAKRCGMSVEKYAKYFL